MDNYPSRMGGYPYWGNTTCCVYAETIGCISGTCCIRWREIGEKRRLTVPRVSTKYSRAADAATVFLEVGGANDA